MFVDFINSDWRDGSGNSRDRLLTRSWLVAFVDRWFSDGHNEPSAEESEQLEPRGVPEDPDTDATRLSPADVDLLMRLRGLLRELVDVISEGREPSRSLVRRLNQFLDMCGVRHRLAAHTEGLALEFVADETDARAIAGAVALDTAQFLSSGDLRRLKQCDNDGCRWVFYDATKNVSKRWCDSNLCGNVDKVRRYRERHKTHHA